MFDILFGFDGMEGTHDQRKVDQYNEDGLFVDTCLVTDGDRPYETAVAHEYYRDGKIVIVEAYDTKEDAQIGHDKWVKIMTTEPLPEKLVDVANSEAQQFGLQNGTEVVFPRKIIIDG